jgi:DNA polymerase/3'-5' exonuclease PolX
MSAPATPYTRMERPEAISIAKSFVAELEGTYEQLIVGGSLRRRLAHIGDIEIVAEPKTATVSGGLFDDDLTTIDLLHGRLEALLDNGTVQQRLDVNGRPRWGPVVKYLTYRDARVDLFCPDAGRFGWILLLRTGPAAYSRQLVVPRGKIAGEARTQTKTNDGRWGLMPPHIVPRDGWLTYRMSGERIETPTERSVFDLFGLPYQEPWERT